MEINISYINDVLSFMIEGQYFTDQKPEYYQDFIDQYRESVFDKLGKEEREQFIKGLQRTLKYVLNEPQLNHNRIFYETALHRFNSQEEARKVFEMIWMSFFHGEDWRDSGNDAANFIVVKNPIW